MFFSRIRPQDLAQRIDPEYHSPKLLAMKKQVQDAFATSSFRAECKRMNSGPFGSALLASDYVEKDKGVMFIRPQDCKDLIVNTDNENVYISHSDNQRLKSSRFGSGAIIITKIGNGIGDMAVVPENILDCNISGNAMGAVLYKHDPYCVIAFLRGRYGQAEVKRGLSGGPKPKIDMDSIGDIVFPLMDVLAQKYIGDKVRQAERLRNWAARAQAQAVCAMPAFKSLISHYAKSSFRVSPGNLLSARLDSEFFHPDHRALDQKMKENGCKNLGKIASSVKIGWDKKATNTFYYYEIGGLNVSDGTVVPVETLTSEAPSRATTAVKQGDVLVSTVRPNRKNVGFIIEDAHEAPMVATSGFSVLQFESLVDAAFYHAWLRTDDATSQLMRWNSGSAYPAIDEDVPLHILVPEFDASLRERLGKILLDTHFALWHSAKLTNAAKLIVEALIEGPLTEAELIAAEQALQGGNDQLDRRILNRLKNDGIDGLGPTLFSDLDDLYRLLAQAEAD